MARTHHHRSYHRFWMRHDPPSYRKMLNRLFRARSRQALRMEKLDAFPVPKRNRGWYW